MNFFKWSTIINYATFYIYILFYLSYLIIIKTKTYKRGRWEIRTPTTFLLPLISSQVRYHSGNLPIYIFIFLAEAEGFEPSEPFGSGRSQCAGLNHSPILPYKGFDISIAVPFFNWLATSMIWFNNNNLLPNKLGRFV